jgi:hypothetical protein
MDSGDGLTANAFANPFCSVPLTYNCQRLYVVSPWRTFASTGAHCLAAEATISLQAAGADRTCGEGFGTNDF